MTERLNLRAVIRAWNMWQHAYESLRLARDAAQKRRHRPRKPEDKAA